MGSIAKCAQSQTSNNVAAEKNANSPSFVLLTTSLLHIFFVRFQVNLVVHILSKIVHIYLEA